MNFQPTSINELQQIVREQTMIVPCGHGSKQPLSTASKGMVTLSLGDLSGLIEYEPHEYTFTAYAGTPLQYIVDALAEHNQYLPFDPMLIHHGATLGGTVATNISGSGRYRYGGVRDFILGCRFVDGQGNLVRGGGKVVKNAAGFDLPKFMVGSLGRYGILTELTFKVFPEPTQYQTLNLEYPTLGIALEAIYQLSNSPFDITALDLAPTDNGVVSLMIRLGGLPTILTSRLNRLQRFLQTNSAPTKITTRPSDTEADYWDMVNNVDWFPKGTYLVKIPLTPRRISLLENVLLGTTIKRRYTVGGNVAWVAVSNLADFEARLKALNLVGLVILGTPIETPYLGLRKGVSLAKRIKQALDPHHKFLAV